MPVDSGLYGQFAPRVVSPMEIQNGLAQQALAQSQFQQNQLSMQKAQADMADTNALRAAYRGGADPSTPEGRNALIQAAPLQAPAIFKANADLAHTSAETNLANAHAADFADQSSLRKIQKVRDGTAALAQQLTTVNSPQDTVNWYQAGIKQGLISPEDAIAEINKVPTDAAGFAQWKQQQQAKGMSVVEQQTQALNKQKAADENARAAATIKKDLQVAGMQQSGENSRAALSRGTQLTIAGLNQDGSVNGNVEQMAQAIANGQVAPLSGFALARPAGQQVMARVMQINPEYDATTFGAKAQAAKAFTTGPQGNSLRSFAVAGQHLDQLGQLADALGNGNIQLVNKIGQTIAEQTGSPVPTNFDAAKDVVSKEVVKAIVAGGGGVAERQELKDLMDKAKSPAQLKGVITQYRNLMQAQHDALIQQRQAAGIPDSTTPNYAPTSGGLPQGWKIEKVSK